MRDTKRIVAWIMQTANCLHTTQVTNWVALARAALAGGSLQCATLATHLPPTTTRKHRIKRVFRWCQNPRLALDDFSSWLIAWLARGQTRVCVQLDWTEIDAVRFPVLVASIALYGRGVPILWRVVRPEQLRARTKSGRRKRQVAIERGFIMRLTRLMPEGVERVLVADRGFRGYDFRRHLRAFGWHYVIRTTGDVRVDCKQHTGPLRRLRLPRNQDVDLGEVCLSETHYEYVRLVVRRDRRAAEVWFVVTSLADPAHDILAIYARRFRIEEAIRDQKSWCFGLGLGSVRLRDPERYERLLAVGVLAALLALYVGRHTERQGHARRFTSNTRATETRRELSCFNLGMLALHDGFRDWCALLRSPCPLEP